ncbi:heme-binding protein [Pararhizobium sp. A13]|uniref:heme-binding protein n=1 Tax=Pararhizobium sp. A13 TaxID=3133975 RepID=UPI00311AFA21
MNDMQSFPLTTKAPNTLRRAVPSQVATADRLGALRDLPGFWEGSGFSLIARPDYSGRSKNGVFLQLNLLHETIEFTTIGSPVFNRGSVQEDIAIYGVTYLHRVTDGIYGGALHIEPGMWLNIPATTAPKANASIARLGTIPHGNAFCTVGFVQHAVFDKVPDIPPANTVPFDIDGQPPAPGSKNPYPEYDLSIASEFRTSPVPAVITQAMIDDPNQMLRDTLNQQVMEEGLTLKRITRLITSTAGGIANIPFITTNANTLDLDSVFAIETVVDALGNEFLQLQYSQTGLLNFGGKSFPHVTVGTLIKAF